METGAIGNPKNVTSLVAMEPSWYSEVVITRLLSMEVINALGFNIKGFRAMSINAQVHDDNSLILYLINVSKKSFF